METRYKFVIECDRKEDTFDRGYYVDTMTHHESVEFKDEKMARSHIKVLQRKPKTFTNIRLYRVPSIWEELEIG